MSRVTSWAINNGEGEVRVKASLTIRHASRVARLTQTAAGWTVYVGHLKSAKADHEFADLKTETVPALWFNNYTASERTFKGQGFAESAAYHFLHRRRDRLGALLDEDTTVRFRAEWRTPEAATACDYAPTFGEAIYFANARDIHHEGAVFKEQLDLEALEWKTVESYDHNGELVESAC